jgi:hypothetical protein
MIRSRGNAIKDEENSKRLEKACRSRRRRESSRDQSRSREIRDRELEQSNRLEKKQSAGKAKKAPERGLLITHTYTSTYLKLMVGFNYIFGPPKFQIEVTLPSHLKSNFIMLIS